MDNGTSGTISNMNSDEENFKSIIVEDYGISDTQSNKEKWEATTTRPRRSANATDTQYEKLISFMKEQPGTTIEWDSLVDELNDIGPPSYTSVQWRRVCTEDSCVADHLATCLFVSSQGSTNESDSDFLDQLAKCLFVSSHGNTNESDSESKDRNGNFVLEVQKRLDAIKIKLTILNDKIDKLQDKLAEWKLLN